MIKVNYLIERHDEAGIDEAIEGLSREPFKEENVIYINSIKQDSWDNTCFILMYDDMIQWYFGPRTRCMSRYGQLKFFACMTEDGKMHKFDVSTVEKCKELMKKFETWFAEGKITEKEDTLYIADTEDFDDI